MSVDLKIVSRKSEFYGKTFKPYATYPANALGKAAYIQNYSNYWMEDGSFIRIKNLRLSYTLPENCCCGFCLLKVISVTCMALLVHMYWYCYLFFIHRLFCTMALVLLLFIQKRNNGQLCQAVTLISTMFMKTKITLQNFSNNNICSIKVGLGPDSARD
jgi:hypothetical protein